MSATKMRKDASSWVESVLQCELASVCGQTACDVLDLALMFSGHANVPTDSDGLRAFIFGELKQTLSRVEGPQVAEDQCARLAGLLLSCTGTHRISGLPKDSITQIRITTPSVDDCHTMRPRASHAKSLSYDAKGHHVEDLLTAVNVEVTEPTTDAACSPVLVLSEFPEVAEEIQQALAGRVEVYHHQSLDFFESDLLILAERKPIVVLDSRGAFEVFSERFIHRADQDLALLVWGRRRSDALPGRRMVSCLATSSPVELAMLVDVFSPQVS